MKISSIQCLRAVAALLVVYVHSIDVQMAYGVSWQQNFFYLQNFGAIGVDIFFVISGFIITYVADRYTGRQNALDFLTKRFLRINPIYYIASAVKVTVTLLFLNPALLPVYMPKMIAGIFDTVLVLPATDGYTPLLPIGWTLSFEWFFYLVFICLIFFKSHNKPLHLVAIIVSLTLIGQAYHFRDYRLVFITNAIMLEFALGIILYRLYRQVNISSRACYLILIIAILGYTFNIRFGYGEISELGGTLDGSLSLQRFFQWGIPSWCLVAGCLFLEKNGVLSGLWSNKILQLLGDASYSIYLIHFPVLMLLMDLLYPHTGFFLPADLAIFFHLLVATVVGIAFYLFVEKPLLKYFMKDKKKSRPQLVDTVPPPVVSPSLPGA